MQPGSNASESIGQSSVPANREHDMYGEREMGMHDHAILLPGMIIQSP